MAEGMSREDVAELDALLKQEPLPAPVLTQDGDPDRMRTVWPQLAQTYVANIITDREQRTE